MKRAALTPSQASIFQRIAQLTYRKGCATSQEVGSTGTCNRLWRKGWITYEEVTGPRGGTTYIYRAVIDAQAAALLDRMKAAREARIAEARS